jgi:hypothetical protein
VNPLAILLSEKILCKGEFNSNHTQKSPVSGFPETGEYAPAIDRGG